jgi:phosphatidylglycerol:prolipoprotein diacylglycerol transferase
VAQTDPAWYLAHPGQILAAWQGGMAFYGAIFLGVPALVVLSRHRRLPVWTLLDGVALFAPLAQAVGRAGNIINGDVVGYPSTLPWATRYTNPHTFAHPGVAYAPAAAYELVFSLLLFAVLWKVRGKGWPPGTLFLLYLTLYASGQFVLFFWRENAVVALGLKQAQLTSLVVLAVSIPALLYRLHGVQERRPAATADRHVLPLRERPGPR